MMKQSETTWRWPVPVSVSQVGPYTVGAMTSVAGGVLLICLGAQVVRIPIPSTDVPMTLQLYAVLVIGYLLTPARAVAATVLYALCGVVGLPVLAGVGGLAGTTGGYVVGFIPAVWLIARLKGAGRPTTSRLVLAGAVGTVVVFAMGITWRLALVTLLGRGEQVASLAITTGLVPFVGKALVEVLLAVACVQSIRRVGDARRKRRQLLP